MSLFCSESVYPELLLFTTQIQLRLLGWRTSGIFNAQILQLNLGVDFDWAVLTLLYSLM